MTIMNMKLNEIKDLSMNQYNAYLYHSANSMSGYRQGEYAFSYDYVPEAQKKEDDLRSRLKQLQAEAEERNAQRR